MEIKEFIPTKRDAKQIGTLFIALTTGVATTKALINANGKSPVGVIGGICAGTMLSAAIVSAADKLGVWKEEESEDEVIESEETEPEEE